MIISQTIIRNEKNRFLKKWFESNLPYFDKMVIYDDASDDGTAEWLQEKSEKLKSKIILVRGVKSLFKFNEVLLRKKLWNEVRKVAKKGDFILTLDSDEIVCDEFRGINKRMPKDKVLASFKKIEMWDDKHYRIDGLWSNYFERGFWFRNEKFGFENEKGHHKPSVPYYAFKSKFTEGVWQSNVRIIHLGYSSPQLRNKKLESLKSVKLKELNYYHLQTINSERILLKKFSRKVLLPKVLLVFCCVRLFTFPEEIIREVNNLDYDYDKVGIVLLCKKCNNELYKVFTRRISKKIKFKKLLIFDSDNTSGESFEVKEESIMLCKKFMNEYDFFVIHDVPNFFGRDWIKQMVLTEKQVVISKTKEVSTILLSKMVIEKLASFGKIINFFTNANLSLINTTQLLGFLVWVGTEETPYPLQKLPSEELVKLC